MYRSWADIEDLANVYETLNSNFEKHRTVTSNAFQEIVKLVEKVKNECITLAQQNASNNIPLPPQIIKESNINEIEIKREISGLTMQLS